MSNSKSTTKFLFMGLLSLVFLGVIIWGFGLEYNANKATQWNFLFNVGYGLIYLLGSIVGIAGSFRVGLKSNEGKGLLFLGASLTSQALGLFTWAYYNLVVHVAIPSPSLGDMFLLVFFLPLVVLGFSFLLGTSEASLSPLSIIAALVVFLASLGVIFGIVERPDISGSNTLIANLISIAYPFVDCILLAFSSFIMLAASPRFRRGFLILFIGFLIQVSADLTYAVRVGQGVYWNGDVADKLYATAAFVLSLGVINLFFWIRDNMTTAPTRPATSPAVGSTPQAPTPASPVLQ